MELLHIGRSNFSLKQIITGLGRVNLISLSPPYLFSWETAGGYILLQPLYWIACWIYLYSVLPWPGKHWHIILLYDDCGFTWSLIRSYERTVWTIIPDLSHSSPAKSIKSVVVMTKQSDLLVWILQFMQSLSDSRGTMAILTWSVLL